MLNLMFPVGWAHYLAGGLCIGLGVAALLVLTGRVGGMSSVYSAVWSFASQRPFFQQPRWLGSRGWRLVYALGLVLGAALWWFTLGGRAAPGPIGVPVWQLLLGGVLVGFGARWSNGCTSGHGICGLGSLQWPSLVAVLTFMATAFATAQAVRAWLGAGA